MDFEPEAPSPRLAFLVRCWLVETEEGPVWRASVEDPHTAEQRTFGDLSSALAFLGEKAKAVLEQHTRRKSIAEQQG
jgi:hypothetical protein